MSRFDHRTTEDELLQGELVRVLKAMIAALLAEINLLRQQHEQAAITKTQFIAKIKAKLWQQLRGGEQSRRSRAGTTWSTTSK